MLSYLSATLAMLDQRSPLPSDLYRALEIADLALTGIEKALDAPILDLEPSAHRAYIAALVLTKLLDRVVVLDEYRLRTFQRTATNMLCVLDRLVSPTDRALRQRLIGELDLPVARYAA